MQITAILRDADGVEQNRVAGDDIDVVRIMVETFLLPAVGPGDTIEFGMPIETRCVEVASVEASRPGGLT